MDATGSFHAALATDAIQFAFGAGDNLDYIAGLVREYGLANYDRPMPELIAWLAGTSNGYMFDIGASSGLFGLLAAAANPGLKVCAFEPLDSACRLFRANLGLNPPLAHRINLYQVGLSSSNGMADFHETVNDHGLVSTSSSFDRDHAQRIGGTYHTRPIETVTLDTWADNRLGTGPVAFMKLAVEGHEHAVIAGARETIARHRPLITVKVLGASPVSPIDDLLFESDYLDFAVSPTTLRQCQAVYFHPDAWNHLLCPFERAALVLELARDLGLTIAFA